MILLGLLNCFLHLSGTVGASDSKHVEQKPPFIIRKYGDSVNNEIKCSHNITDYNVILWYKQDRGKSLKLLGYLYNNNLNFEEDLEERIRFDGDGRKESTLRVTDLNFSDSALYFCAASYTVL
uniref:Ig-like domain-containing protein n=1 Tax=Gouania willdenowi TaxID=441366 RepID=A0A8C5DIG2_GOUWI